MNITLAAAQRRFVADLVASGRYVDESEVVRSALRQMEAQVAMATGGSTYPVLGTGSEGDIMALAFIVMMEAAKSAREDLKAIMAKVKAINNAKAALREALAKAQRDAAEATRPCGDDEDNKKKLDFTRGLGSERAYHQFPMPTLDPDAAGGVRYDKVDLYPGRITTAAQLECAVEALENKLDSLSELGEEQQLRMQMYMDRMSKADAMLSNMMKKFSETAASIVQNLK